MKNKFIILFLFLIAIAVGGVYLYLFKGTSVSYLNLNDKNSLNFPPKNQDTQNGLENKNNISNQKIKSYLWDDILKHNSQESCFTVIDGGVYDLTLWISKHPSGEKAILNICGKDGTKAFENQHNGNKKVEQILEQFKIGELKN